MTTTTEKGNISIHTENIFPIIKKFLYSDHDIFLRELVSNAVDANQKIKFFSRNGEFSGELGDLKVTVSFDKEAKTITVSDTGIGMTADEIKKYINQIAFSGATEFLDKYKDKEDAKQQVIGHFGLGFYSAFMVASEVEIITKSFREGSTAARWVCDGSTEFEITEATRETRGTDIILHIAEDSLEFLESFKLKGILNTYCKFLPITVEFEGEVINNTTPLWTRKPADITEEEYLAFYKELYPMAADPLFHIHLNVEYPFALTGILYFPQVKPGMDFQRDKIQLYSRQVFITDEVKDVVPEFLMLLQGVIDSPEIPLNVSRSFLQADKSVKQISTHITAKVAAKLQDLFSTDRSQYEAKWDSIGLFVKYGMISDPKFLEKTKDIVLLKSVDSKYYTTLEYTEAIKAHQTNKDGKLTALYANDKDAQGVYIAGAKKAGYDVLLLDTVIDMHFINTLETILEGVTLKRVDADTVDKLIEKDVVIDNILTEDQIAKVKKQFVDTLRLKEESVSIVPQAPDAMPVTLTQPEMMRRMREMYANQGMGALFGGGDDALNLVINANHPIIAKIAKADEGSLESENTINYLYDLGLLGQNKLTGEKLYNFIASSVSKLS